MPPVRRLTAILAADVAGYSRLMGADEEGTHERPISRTRLVAPGDEKGFSMSSPKSWRGIWNTLPEL